VAIGTIVIGLLCLAGAFFSGRLLWTGLRTGRMVAFHYMRHVAERQDNRFGFLATALYNIFWFVLSAALLLATILGRFN
jgi:hypothetical protein